MRAVLRLKSGCKRVHRSGVRSNFFFVRPALRGEVLAGSTDLRATDEEFFQQFVRWWQRRWPSSTLLRDTLRSHF